MNNIFQKVQATKISSLYGTPTVEGNLEKGGKRAQVGEIRIWDGVKYVKHAEGWVYLKKNGSHGIERPGGKREPAEPHHIDHHKEHIDKHKETSITSKEVSKTSSEDETRISLKEKLIKQGFSPEEADKKLKGNSEEKPKSKLEIYNKKNTEFERILEKLNDHTKGVKELSDSEVKELKQKKEILTVVIKKLEKEVAKEKKDNAASNRAAEQAKKDSEEN